MLNCYRSFESRRPTSCFAVTLVLTDAGVCVCMRYVPFEIRFWYEDLGDAPTLKYSAVKLEVASYVHVRIIRGLRVW